MLTKYDELLCHQVSTSFDHVHQSDLRWTERVVVYGFEKSGGFNFMTGVARYANRNVIDAYGMVTIGDKEAHVVRMSSELRPESGSLSATTVGPYSYDIVEPLKRVRAQLDPNEHGLSFDIGFDGTFPTYEQEPAFFRRNGRVLEDARRFYQNGTLTGWFDVQGERHEVDPPRWWVGRDHSWGTRWGGGGGGVPEGSFLQPPDIPEGVLYFMCIFQFDDWLLHVAQREDAREQRWHFEGGLQFPLGSEKPAIPVTEIEHDFSFRSDRRVVETGNLLARAADGSSREVSIRALTTFWPGLAGYDLYNDYMSGMWKGPSYSDGFRVDLTDADEVRKVSMLSETLCEVTCGDEIGYGLLEMVCLGAYPRYGFKGYV
jgi:hypothetical protein